MSEHTPGPWEIQESLDGGSTRQILRRDDHPTHGPYWVVARVNLCMGSESDANARLIAAAPDLLDALNYLLEQTVDADLKHGIALTEGEADAREKALAAIAKAKGEA